MTGKEEPDAFGLLHGRCHKDVGRGGAARTPRRERRQTAPPSFVFAAIDKYQDKTASTAVYPGATAKSLVAVQYCALGLASEAGEVAGQVKRILRDDGGALTPSRKTQLLGELGDVLWYVARLADELGLLLSDVAAANLAKLVDRAERDRLHGEGER